jgi:hypothetical protein
MKAKLFFIFALTLTLGACKGDTRHKATIYKTKKHHIVMKDDQGKWYEYVLKGVSDVDFDIPFNPRGEMVLPAGGSWRRGVLIQEEEEVTQSKAQATNAEETTVDETDAGAVDGAGDVGGDDGGAGGDSGGADGGDGGGGDGD